MNDRDKQYYTSLVNELRKLPSTAPRYYKYIPYWA